jgi:hypothetical protein
VGIGLGDGLGAGVTVVVVVSVGVTVIVVVEELGGVSALFGATAVTVVEPPEAVIVYVDTGGPEEDAPDGEQAESAAVPSRAKATQPAAVSVARGAVLPIPVRTFIEPPHAPFPSARRQKTGTGKKHAAARSFARVSRRQPPVTVMLRLMGGANTQWRAHHSNIRLRQ